MFRPYFMEQMVGLNHTSFHIYNQKNELVQRFGTRRPGEDFFKENAGILKDIFSGQAGECPVLLIDHLTVYAIFSRGMQEGTIMVAGPVASGPPGKAELMEYHKRYGVKESQYYIPPVCPLNRFLAGILLLHNYLTGEEMTLAELWDRNKGHYTSTANMDNRTFQDIFERLENPGIHNPYEQELRELDSIEKGDVEALSRSISEVYEGEIGVLADNPLRSQKNVAVGNITLVSRAAIRGGMSVEQSFSLADSLIRQVEEIHSVPEVEAFKREVQYTYARMVHDGKPGGGKRQKNSKNPLIARTKDYIFNHLHDTIQVTDIAEELQINADYLSHVFSSSENMTIREYIRREKIRRGENLLKYSDYGIQNPERGHCRKDWICQKLIKNRYYFCKNRQNNYKHKICDKEQGYVIYPCSFFPILKL